MANPQIGALIRELFGNFPLRVKLRRGKSAVVVASTPQGMTMEEDDDRLLIQGNDWRLLLGGVDRARFTKTGSDKKLRREVVFFDAGGKAVLHLALRRMDERRAASLDRLEKKYEAVITRAEPQQGGESA